MKTVTDFGLAQGETVLHVGPHVRITNAGTSQRFVDYQFVSAEAECTGCGRRVATRAESRWRSVNDWAALHECRWVRSTRREFLRGQRG